MKRLLMFILMILCARMAVAQQVNHGLSDYQLRLQPNPASRYVEVHFVVPAGMASIALFNVLGQKVKPVMQVYSEGDETSIPLDLNGLPHGVYLVRVQYAGQAAIRRLTIQ